MQAEVRQLKQSNTVLGQQLALHEVEGPSLPHPRSPLKQVPVPSQTAGLGEGCHSAQAKQHMQASKMKFGGIDSLEEQVHNKLPKASNIASHHVESHDTTPFHTTPHHTTIHHTTPRHATPHHTISINIPGECLPCPLSHRPSPHPLMYACFAVSAPTQPSPECRKQDSCGPVTLYAAICIPMCDYAEGLLVLTMHV